MKLKIKNTIYLLSFVALGLLSACKGEKNPETSKTSLITESPWVISKMTIDDGLGEFYDMLELMEDCDKDDLWKFGTDKVLKLTEGPTSCDGEFSEQTMSWSFGSNESTLILDGDPYELETLNSSSLKFSVEEDGATWTFHLSHP